MTTHAVATGPLKDAEIMAFVATRDGAAARTFYEGKLGFEVVSDDEMALVLNAGGTMLRVQKIPKHEPESYTVLGWRVTDIATTVQRLASSGVKVEHYDWMSYQSDDGIATFPNGDKVAWFKDPDGNILSVAQIR